MKSSVFLADRHNILIADASVIINLNATGHVRRIIASIGRILVPANARRELAIGAQFGYSDGDELDLLIASGVVELIELGPQALVAYESLIDGSRGKTLDDGEAATIAAALEHNAVALLDEKKARRICAEEFPNIEIGCSAELLLSSIAELGLEARVEAIINALQKGRMRVPPEFVDGIVKLIGPEKAMLCSSLPRSARQIPQTKE